MKPVLHGVNQLSNVKVEMIPTDKVNVTGLINMFEANLDKQIPKDWSQLYQTISTIYRLMFFKASLPEQLIKETSYDIFEMASECLNEELETLIETPRQITGQNFYYEFARSLAVENQALEMKEYLDEECDFI